MVIITEKKTKNLSEDTGTILLQDFVKMIGRKKVCTAEGKTKSGLMDFIAYPPAFCGFMNGYFFLTEGHGKLSIRFSVKAIVSIGKEDALPVRGSVDKYIIYLRDGLTIGLILE